MRIGFDAKWYFSGNPSGRIVVRNMLREFLLKYPDIEFVIFLQKKDQKLDFFLQSPNLSLVYISGRNNLISNLLFLPFAARRHRLDALISFYFSPPLISCKSILVIFDAIFLTHPHWFTWRERLYFMPIRWMSRWSDIICTISESEKNRLRKFSFFKNKPIQVMHLAADERFQPAEKMGTKKIEEIRQRYHLPEKYLLYVGRLNERKNIGNLLKAFSQGIPDTHFLVLAGDYSWKIFDVPKMICQLNLEGRVMILDRVLDEDLPVIYSLAEVFCFLSFDEGFGLPPLESMASGVPVIASPCGALPEVCGNAALYADPDSPQDIAEAIRKLIETPELHHQFRQKGLERASMFKWEHSAKTLVELSIGEKT